MWRYGIVGAIVIALVSALFLLAQLRGPQPEHVESTHQQEGPGALFETLKVDHNKLREQVGSPEQMGRYYASLAASYSRLGIDNPELVRAYAEKALEYPLSPDLKMGAYSNLAGAHKAELWGATDEARLAARPELVVPYLKAIRVTVEAEIPDLPLSLPVYPRLHGSGSLYDEKKAKYARLEVVRTERKAINEIVQRRHRTEFAIASLYAEPPQNPDELRDLAREYIQDDHAVDRLMAMVEEHMNEWNAGNKYPIPRGLVGPPDYLVDIVLRQESDTPE